MLIFWLIVGAFLFALWGIRSFFYARVSKYDYLQVLTFNWERGRIIRRKMEKLKKGRIGGVSFYNDLAQLVEEELVELELRQKEVFGAVVQRSYYRLSKKGMRRIEDEERTVNLSLLDSVPTST